MRRLLTIVGCLVALVGSFVAGVIVGNAKHDYWYGAFDTDGLVTRIKGGDLALGSAWDDVPLVKEKAGSERTKPNGDEERTAIFQDSDYVVLVNATNGRIDRLGVWKYGFAHAEFYADANDKVEQDGSRQPAARRESASKDDSNREP